jgi:hypothetical protein
LKIKFDVVNYIVSAAFMFSLVGGKTRERERERERERGETPGLRHYKLSAFRRKT